MVFGNLLGIVDQGLVLVVDLQVEVDQNQPADQLVEVTVPAEVIPEVEVNLDLVEGNV